MVSCNQEKKFISIFYHGKRF